MKNILTYVISLAVAGGLLWFVFKDIDLKAMFAAIGQANWLWVGAYAAILLVAHYIRGLRWGMLLEPVAGHRPTPGNTMLSVLTNYFANLLVPRMGEVTRCGTMNRLEGVPVNVSLGTVVAERIFDVVMLVVVIGLTLVLEFDRISDLVFGMFAQKGGTGSRTGLYLLLAVGLAGAVVAWFLYQKYKEALRKNTLFAKVETFVLGLIDGLLSVRKLRQPGLFVVYTALIWVLYYLSTYILFFAMPQTAGLGLLACLTILMMGSIGMAAPTQGGLGAFNIMVGSALALYGLTKQDGQTLATLMLLSQWAVTIIFGGLAFLIVLNRRKKAGPAVSAEPVGVGQ
ncbi:lysylphosphatidylglycerol synthase transmembrane domain-containing protein [Fibrella aquatilis]|uniref:Flippase-like domain-containing protein n=1 Tax=Fibrella aquatilis TaxID=2817059 RepID=A0A939G866_9BACT|nr:lysylphosphatidylglycerol synthase transmembrane domain-containing protein [Fibrella aquatilis]MBO0932414.1 flippase-like domain-containing protein [Fibrella aquatilis]